MIIRTLLLVIAGTTIAGVAYVRLSPMDPARWHVDPATATRTGNPNDYLVSEGGEDAPMTVDVAPAAILARLDTVAMAEPGVTRLAGSPEEGFVTYVQRSKLLAFPDAISVTAMPTDTGSLLRIYSRSRYGKADLGVNEARVKRWLAALES